MNQLRTNGTEQSTPYIDTNPWYDKYLNLPYLHLGNNPKTGIDCFNLCRLIYKEQLDIMIPYTTSDWCNIVDQDWYDKTTIDNMGKAATEAYGWQKVSTPEKFDVITMSIGSTNVTNHCALYLGGNKMLQTMIDRVCWVEPYGKYYKNYTIGIFKWIGIPN